MLSWLRGWGDDVEVIEPNNLREAIKVEVERLARLYGIESSTPKYELSYRSNSMNLEPEPRAFQIKVSEVLLKQKQNVNLQAPLGAGKTGAAIMPFTHALKYPTYFPEFPKKCLCDVPMRVLTNQFVVKYAHSLDFQNIRVPMKQQREGKDPLVDIQTGEQRRDPRLESALTFMTIDQLLSSFLGAPYSLPRWSANMNVVTRQATRIAAEQISSEGTILDISFPYVVMPSNGFVFSHNK